MQPVSYSLSTLNTKKKLQSKNLRSYVNDCSMQHIFPHAFLYGFFGCTSHPPEDPSNEPSLSESRTYIGTIRNPPACAHTINIDVIEAGSNKPIVYTHAEEDGSFTVTIPDRVWDAPLSIHSFCYATQADLRDNVVQWKTEPLLLLPTQPTTAALELQLESTQNAAPSRTKHTEPAIQEAIPTEYSVWVQNTLLIEYYGLRFPDHKLTTSGSLPEVRQGGLTVATRTTLLFATLDFIRSNSDPSSHPLLLPSNDQLMQVSAIVDPTSIELDVIETQINVACDTLGLPCPSANLLRQQEWILKDKRQIDTVELTQTRAHLWLLGHHLIQTLQRRRVAIPTTIPLPQDLRAIESSTDASDVYQRWVALYATYNLALPTWRVDGF